MADKDGKFIYGKLESAKNNTLFLNNNREIKYSDINSILIKNHGYFIKTSLIALGLLATGVLGYFVLREDTHNVIAFVLPFNYLLTPTVVGHFLLKQNTKYTSEWYIEEAIE